MVCRVPKPTYLPEHLPAWAQVALEVSADNHFPLSFSDLAEISAREPGQIPLSVELLFLS